MASVTVSGLGGPTGSRALRQAVSNVVPITTNQSRLAISVVRTSILSLQSSTSTNGTDYEAANCRVQRLTSTPAGQLLRQALAEAGERQVQRQTRHVLDPVVGLLVVVARTPYMPRCDARRH